MRILFRLSILAACLLAPIMASADMSYTWVEGGWLRITPGTTGEVTPFTSPTITGKFVDASWGAADHLALSAGYDFASQGYVVNCSPTCQPSAGSASAPFVLGNHDLHELKAAVTYHAELAPGLQWLASLDYRHEDYRTHAFLGSGHICVPGNSCGNGPITEESSSTGNGLSAGLRWQPWDAWEFEGRVGHISMDQHPYTGLDVGSGYMGLGDASANFFEADAGWYLAAHWSLRLGLTHLSNAHNRYTFGIRYSF